MIVLVWCYIDYVADVLGNVVKWSSDLPAGARRLATIYGGISSSEPYFCQVTCLDLGDELGGALVVLAGRRLVCVLTRLYLDVEQD